MHLTRYTDYSLRVLMYLALKGDRPATIAEIAEHYRISRNHLMKVVQELNSKGYLVASRGKHGGLRLEHPPEAINVGALVRDTERDLALVECFSDTDACVFTRACKLKHVFAEGLEGFFSVLDRYTLADLLPAADRPQMIHVLNMPTA
jgi:Rrf2 family nitric oxide-sensitive transcriptional repressor